MYEIAEDQESRRIRQLSVFLPNRLGALLAITRLLEREDIHICAISIAEAADHAVVRMVVDKPTLAFSALENADYSLFESDLIGVVLPASDHPGIRGVLQAMLVGELNIQYVYSLITPPDRPSVLALYVDEMTIASRLLVEKGFELVGQDDL